MPCWALLRSVFVSLKKASVWSNMANLSDSANCILKRILNWRCWEKVYFSSKPPVLVKIKVCGMRIFFSGKMRLFILVFSGIISGYCRGTFQFFVCAIFSSGCPQI